MAANVTALRAGRTRALVQRPGRKAHVASIGAGETAWIAICDRLIPAEGASFWINDAVTVGVEHDEDLCLDCRSITVLVGWILEQTAASPAYRQEATR